MPGNISRANNSQPPQSNFIDKLQDVYREKTSHLIGTNTEHGPIFSPKPENLLALNPQMLNKPDTTSIV